MAESVEHTPVEEGTQTTRIMKFDPLKQFSIKHDTPPKKILFLGDQGIGKTTFIQKYCEHVVNYHKCSGYNSSRLVFTEFLVYHNKDDKSFLIRIIDLPTGTTEESRKDQYPDEIDSIVLCFAIDNPTSFANVWKIWLLESRKYYPDINRIYLLGLRNDTRQEMLETNKTPVTLERGCQIHQKYKFWGEYMECSVKENPQQAGDLMKILIADVL